MSHEKNMTTCRVEMFEGNNSLYPMSDRDVHHLFDNGLPVLAITVEDIEYLRKLLITVSMMATAGAVFLAYCLGLL